jgi:hypothetical protein
VVDKETAADGGAGVDFDSGEESAGLRDESRLKGHAPAVQFVRHAVRQDGVKAGVAQDDFDHALGGRVFPEDGVDLFADGAEHVWT